MVTEPLTCGGLIHWRFDPYFAGPFVHRDLFHATGDLIHTECFSDAKVSKCETSTFLQWLQAYQKNPIEHRYAYYTTTTVIHRGEVGGLYYGLKL